MARTLGVDLGTTWTAAAVLNDSAGSNAGAGPDSAGPDTTGEARPEPVMLTARSKAMPSVVALADGARAGEGADGGSADAGLVAGEAAERILASDPTLGAREFKRRLGDETPYIIGSTPVGTEALMAAVLKAAIAHPAVAAAAPDGIERVVLTHPANWGEYKLDLVREIARLAGVDEFDTISEPAAAAIEYAAQGRLSVGDAVAVYDFGGGTFDAAVVRLESSGPVIVGRPDGLERLGGIDLDQAVLQHVDQALGGPFAELDVTDVEVRNGLFRLRQECTLAKEALSDATEVSIPVVLPGLNTEVRLTRSEFEAAVAPRLDDTFAALDRAVESTGTTMDELAGVLLVGGSSRLPLVGERLASHTGRPVLVDADPKMVVALGAAGMHHYERLAASAATGRADGPDGGENGPAGHGADEHAETAVFESPAELAAAVKVDKAPRDEKADAAAKAEKERRKRKRTAKRVAGGVAAAGAAAGAAGLAAAAVADAGPLAGIGPLEGDFDLGDALGDVADGTKAAFGFPTSDPDEANGESGFDPGTLGGVAGAAGADAIRDLLSGDDELDEFIDAGGFEALSQQPIDVGATPDPSVGFAGPGAGPVGVGTAPGPGPAMPPPTFRSAPARPAPPAAPAHRPSAPPQPPAEHQVRPPMPPRDHQQPAQGAERPPMPPQDHATSRPEPAAGLADPELEAVRSQLRERLETWERPEGVDPEDAARLQRDLERLLDRYHRDPEIPIEHAIADLRYEFEDRMRDFAQDQKIDALIEEEEREEAEQQALEDGVEQAKAQLTERLGSWAPPEGTDPAEAEALRAELTELLDRYVPTPGQTVDDAIAELRAGFNDRVGDFSQDLRIDALIDEVEGRPSEAGADQASEDGDPEAEETAAEGDPADGEFHDAFDDAESGEIPIQLTKEARVDDDVPNGYDDVSGPPPDDSLFDDLVTVGIGGPDDPGPDDPAVDDEADPGPDGSRPVGPDGTSNSPTDPVDDPADDTATESDPSEPAGSDAPVDGISIEDVQPEPAYEPELEPAYEPEPEPAYEPEPEPAYEPEPVYEPELEPAYEPEPEPVYDASGA